jgi:DNA repair protein RecO (recombination protein O)
VIASGYTRDYGLMSFMVRGIGKKRGNKLSALEPLALVEITFHYREKYDVQTVKEIHAKSGSSSLFYDPVKGSVQLFLAEMLYKSLREESSDEELFEYVTSALQFFNSGTNHAFFHLIFLIRLTKFLGFYPKGKFTDESHYFDLQNGVFTSNRNSSLHTLDQDVSRHFAELISSEYDTEIRMIASVRRKLLWALVEYYRLHLEGFGEVKSLPVLMEVFSN